MKNRSDPKDRISDLYNRVASRYGQVGPRVFEHFGRRLVELVEFSENAQILDVATGRGASLLSAAQAINHQGYAIGIDLTFTMLIETLSEANSLGIKNIYLCQMDGERLAFGPNIFDAILCGFGIFFFSNPEQALEEWYRVLVPLGKLGLCLAGKGDERWRWYEELLLAYHQRYQFSISPVDAGPHEPKAIIDLMSKAGFTAINTIDEEYEFIYSNEDEWWEAKWTHGARFPLEQMSQDVLSHFKAQVFQRLQSLKQPYGFSEKWHAIYILGKK